jgi:Uma2 family endonuclease
MSSQSIPFVPLEEYLAHEEQTDRRSEYLHGEVSPMEDATFDHGIIAANLLAALHGAAKVRGCRVVDSSVRVSVNATGLYTYPDLTVICGPPQFSDIAQSAVTNPKIIFEIESPTSKDRDMGKFKHYRTLPSLNEYLLVAQDTPAVNHFCRQPDNSWSIREINGLESTLPLNSLDFKIPLSVIYDSV